MSKRREQLVEQRLERLFRKSDRAAPAAQDPRTADFCFHMTDWIDDLRELHALFKNPSRYTDEQWFDVVYGFLIHASGHIAAAAKLMDVEPVKFKTPKRNPRKSR